MQPKLTNHFLLALKLRQQRRRVPRQELLLLEVPSEQVGLSGGPAEGRLGAEPN